MKLLLVALLCGAAYGQQPAEVEPLTAAEKIEIADAESAVRAAEERLLLIKSRIRHAHGYKPVASGGCTWTEVEIWQGAFALKTSGRACGSSSQTETAAAKPQ